MRLQIITITILSIIIIGFRILVTIPIIIDTHEMHIERIYLFIFVLTLFPTLLAKHFFLRQYLNNCSIRFYVIPIWIVLGLFFLLLLLNPTSLREVNLSLSKSEYELQTNYHLWMINYIYLFLFLTIFLEKPLKNLILTANFFGSYSIYVMTLIIMHL